MMENVESEASSETMIALNDSKLCYTLAWENLGFSVKEKGEEKLLISNMVFLD